MSTFNAAEYIARKNAEEAAKLNGKPVETKPAEAKPVNPPKPQEEVEPEAPPVEQPRPSRSQRRLLKQLGEAEGRAKTLQEMIDKGLVKPAAPTKPVIEPSADPEPLRKDFKSDADYYRAIGKWEARQETKKVVTDTSKQQEEARQRNELVTQMDAKAQEDKALFEDWDAIAEEAIEDGPEFVPAEHPLLWELMMRSDVKAGVLYHFSKYPDALERMLNLKDNPNSLIASFHRLEGKLEDDLDARRKKASSKDKKAEDKKDDTKPPEKKVLSAAERDARKPKPSEAAAARGGSAPSQATSPVLADGKTANPVWLAERNAREAQR
jgi:hypothetical protein